MVNWQIPQGRWHRPLGDQSPHTPPDPAPPAPVIEHQEAGPVLRYVLYEPTTACAVCARAEDPRPALIQRLAPLAINGAPDYAAGLAVMLGYPKPTAYDRHRADWMRDGQLVDIERMLRHDLPPEPRRAPPQLPLTRWRVTWAPTAGRVTVAAVNLAVLLFWVLGSHQLYLAPVAVLGIVAAGMRRRP